MEIYKGKSIFQGIAIGNIRFYAQEQQEVMPVKIEDRAFEWEKYEKAKKQAEKQLKELYDKAVAEVGEANAQIFEVHSMMLEDEDYHDFVADMIKNQGFNGEYAVMEAGEHFAEIFADMEDEYFRARAMDVKDVSKRLVDILGSRVREGSLKEPAIIAAQELAPSETLQMDRTKLLAFVTESGSSSSHTAILARTMNIPALIGVRINEEWDGRLAIVDGYFGTLYIDPDQETLREFQRKKQEERKEQEMYEALKGKENVTPSGRKIRLCANIGSVSDLAAVLHNDAGGIGLFRSEFLYLEREDYPTEEEQFIAYKKAAETMAGRPVIIRTMDIGADKKADYFRLPREENPAMGYRAIRICLERTDIFKTQLRAILRASVYGNIAVMYPMIISVSEVRRIKEIMAEAKKELIHEGISFRDIAQGIMIETPAAAVISDLLAKEADFFSIGTNDLTQYTLAVDRQNAKLDGFYDAHHQAVLRMIKMVVENAHKAGIWAGICGELGADTSLTEYFLEMGVDELSVSPGLVLLVRKAIRESRV
ncbi:MAG: phosphoenolpyruvate--protein phosphotransferase [Roseburia sp.]|nr:phosphoenolpyruvate--protein phosphotransferase [Roseburia sp.]MCM1279016.1 phosphoenolpyruvate--protein phosphotransferase [Robinsoniella sp.]